MSHTSRFLAPTIATFALITSSVTAFAGSYGDTAVRRGAVANATTNEATVICPRLERRIPESLAAQMDCGIGQARPAVAGERVTNRPAGGFFERFRHQRSSGPEVNDDDGPSLRPRPTPGDGEDIASPGPDTPEPTPPTGGDNSGSKDKWERLGELGITGENYDQQPQEIRDQIQDFLADTPASGDWSGFNPS